MSMCTRLQQYSPRTSAAAPYAPAAAEQRQSAPARSTAAVASGLPRAASVCSRVAAVAAGGRLLTAAHNSDIDGRMHRHAPDVQLMQLPVRPPGSLLAAAAAAAGNPAAAAAAWLLPLTLLTVSRRARLPTPPGSEGPVQQQGRRQHTAVHQRSHLPVVCSTHMRAQHVQHTSTCVGRAHLWPEQCRQRFQQLPSHRAAATSCHCCTASAAYALCCTVCCFLLLTQLLKVWHNRHNRQLC